MFWNEVQFGWKTADISNYSTKRQISIPKSEKKRVNETKKWNTLSEIITVFDHLELHGILERCQVKSWRDVRWNVEVRFDGKPEKKIMTKFFLLSGNSFSPQNSRTMGVPDLRDCCAEMLLLFKRGSFMFYIQSLSLKVQAHFSSPQIRKTDDVKHFKFFKKNVLNKVWWYVTAKRLLNWI